MDTKDFQARDGKTYQLRMDYLGEDIEVYLNEVKLGRISMRYIEIPNDPYYYFYITDLSLESCKGQGIGRACLNFHKEIHDAHIVAADPNCSEQDDGSHLIDDGIPFIDKMREEGIVCPPYQI